jgi:hypothetical protein
MNRIDDEEENRRRKRRGRGIKGALTIAGLM